MRNILVAREELKTPMGLQHVGESFRVLYDTRPGWPHALMGACR